MSDNPCECYGCMKYGDACHGLTAKAEKFLISAFIRDAQAREIDSIRRDIEQLKKEYD